MSCSLFSLRPPSPLRAAARTYHYVCVIEKEEEKPREGSETRENRCRISDLDQRDGLGGGIEDVLDKEGLGMGREMASVNDGPPFCPRARAQRPIGSHTHTGHWAGGPRAS